MVLIPDTTNRKSILLIVVVVSGYIDVIVIEATVPGTKSIVLRSRPPVAVESEH